MNPNQYPEGWVKALLETDCVKEPAKKLLNQRLEEKEVLTPVFFSAKSFSILKYVCIRLIPQDRRLEKVDLPGLLDTHMNSSPGNGWRYDAMPPDQKSFEMGLSGIDEISMAVNGKSFSMLDGGEMDQILIAVQCGNAKGGVWDLMPSNLFFEELLAILVELYYSHPIGKDEIGDVSFADAKGWKNIGLNMHDVQESFPLNKNSDDR